MATLHSLLRARPVLAACALCIPFSVAFGADPTKPPKAWLAAQPGGMPEEAADHDAKETPIVVTGRGGGFVMFKGHAVKPGETYNGAKLVSVGPEGAVWERDGKREGPAANPAIQKTAAATAGGDKPVRKTKKAQKQPTGGVQ